jgi:hypothetical protein
LAAACIRSTESAAAFTMSRLANPADERIRRNTPSAIPTYKGCRGVPCSAMTREERAVGGERGEWRSARVGALS